MAERSSFDLDAFTARNDRELIRAVLRASRGSPRERIFLIRAAVRLRHARRIRNGWERQGRHIPSFLIASVSDRCNLACAGCYARANGLCGDAPSARDALSAARWDNLFGEAERLGVSFVLLAGGEPMLRPDVLDAAARHPGLTFPIFTNGTLIDGPALDRFARHRNLVPILSIEGGRDATDARRGAGAADRVEAAMASLSRRRILFGASITVTCGNVGIVASDDQLNDLHRRGCGVVLLIEYVPAEPGTEHLVLRDEDREKLLARVAVLRRSRRNLAVIAFPGDEAAMGGCLAAGRGFFHIDPTGRAEPCPFSPHSDTDLATGSILDALASPLFRRIRETDGLMGEHTGGCVLFGKDEEIRQLLNRKD